MSNKQGTNEALTQLRKSTFFPMLPPAEQFDLMTLFEGAEDEEARLCADKIRQTDQEFIEAENSRKKNLQTVYDELLELLPRLTRKDLKKKEQSDRIEAEKELSAIDKELDRL